MATETLVPTQKLKPHAKPKEFAAPSRPLLGRIAAGMLSGLLLWLCFFPVNWGFLAWFAMVPLLTLIRATGPRWVICMAAFLGGFAFYWPALSWMRVADPTMAIAWQFLAIYCALYTVIGIFLARLLDQKTRLPLIVTVPAVFAGLEYLRSWLLTGFAWYFLGHSQHNFLPVIQIADLTGVYGVSFLLLAVNALLFTLLYQLKSFRTFFRLDDSRVASSVVVQISVVVVMLCACLIYGLYRCGQTDFGLGPRLAILQGNLDQRLRNTAYNENSDDNEADAKEVKPRLSPTQITKLHYFGLCDIALNRIAMRPDLLIWPETSYPAHYYTVSNDTPVELIGRGARIATDSRQGFSAVGKAGKTNHLVGVNHEHLDSNGEWIRFNTALMLEPSGEVNQSYKKIHRLPFGEYVPMRETFPIMKKLVPYDFPYSIKSGEEQTRFKLGKYRFGVLICYEDTDPALSRNYGRKTSDGPPVDFLINMSNDGWFDGTAEHEQHLAISRFRAIECRRAIARSVNMGISGIIDSNGRVYRPRPHKKYDWKRLGHHVEGKTHPEDDQMHWVVHYDERFIPHDLDDWSKLKKVSGVIESIVPIDNRTSLYVTLGDWLAWLCWSVIVGAIVWMIVDSIRRRRVVVAGKPS